MTLTAARTTPQKRCCTGSTGLWKSSARLLLMRWSATNARRKALLRSLRDQASYRTSCASFSAHLVSSAAAFFPFCPVQMVKTAGATLQQGVFSELTFFNLGYTLDKLEIFNFSLIALIASIRLIRDCQLKYRLITYSELSRRH